MGKIGSDIYKRLKYIAKKNASSAILQTRSTLLRYISKKISFRFEQEWPEK